MGNCDPSSFTSQDGTQHGGLSGYVMGVRQADGSGRSRERDFLTHGTSAAIQALRSVLNAFSVVNRKNMFVYQERATKAVYYLRYVDPEEMG